MLFPFARRRVSGVKTRAKGPGVKTRAKGPGVKTRAKGPGVKIRAKRPGELARQDSCQAKIAGRQGELPVQQFLLGCEVAHELRMRREQKSCRNMRSRQVAGSRSCARVAHAPGAKELPEYALTAGCRPGQLPVGCRFLGLPVGCRFLGLPVGCRFLGLPVSCRLVAGGNSCATHAQLMRMRNSCATDAHAQLVRSLD